MPRRNGDRPQVGREWADKLQAKLRADWTSKRPAKTKR